MNGATVLACKACTPSLLFADATDAERQSADAGLVAWKRAAKHARGHLAPRRALARLYRQVERWEPLAEVLAEMSRLARDGAERREILDELADVYRERLNRDMMLARALDELRALDPHDVTVLDRLALLYEKMSRWTDLISTLRERAAATSGLDERAAIYLRIGELFVERFGNQSEALAAFEKVLELQPDNRQVIELLSEIYERRRDRAKLAALRKR
jgi:tetratricopeptide (TPR) repeat protein